MKLVSPASLGSLNILLLSWVWCTQKVLGLGLLQQLHFPQILTGYMVSPTETKSYSFHMEARQGLVRLSFIGV